MIEMKKLFVLLSSVLVAGCFVCHKGADTEKKEIVEQQVRVQEEDIITRHSFPELANFEFDSKVAQADMDKMTELDQDIKAHPEAIIVVEGHTDNVGSEEYNKDLSLERARAVAAILEQQGYPNSIRIYGAGYSAPIATNETDEGRAKNRRVDVLLVKSDEE